MSAGIRIVPINKRDAWNTAVVGSPRADLLQSWEWGEFKRSGGWKPVRVMALRGDEPVAGVQILARRVMGTPSLYAPRGPWWRDDDGLAVLVRWLRRHYGMRAPFLRADPLIVDAKSLTRLGFALAPRQVQPRATIVVDLTRSPDDILAACDRQVRYNIRLAERKGIDITVGGVEAVREFYALLEDTAKRKGFVERDVSYFVDLVRTFGDDAPVYLAKRDGELLYGAIIVKFGEVAYYLYGGSGGDRSAKPSELVQYRAMLWAKGRGATRYDMWGIPAHPTEDNPLYGVYRFKSGFGGHEEVFTGALDLPLLPLVGTAPAHLEVLALKALSLARGKGFRLEDHLA